MLHRKKDKEIEKLTSAITKAKNKYRELEEVIAVKDQKIIDFDNKLHRTSTRYMFDEMIEPTFINQVSQVESGFLNMNMLRIILIFEKNIHFELVYGLFIKK
jgi:hypothetical protein